MADDPYKIGDFIVLDTGERGEVTYIGIRSTRILTRADVEITLEDPGAYTALHTFVRTFTLRPDWELLEYVCNEFNVDVEHL